MPANLNQPHRWKEDIARSVDAFNAWFLENAPSVFQEQRAAAAADVRQAMRATANFTKIGSDVLKHHPNILPTLRMVTCPPLARDRVVGLAKVSKNLVLRMEKRGSVPPRLPSQKLYDSLSRIANVVRNLVDRDICPWLENSRHPKKSERHRASVIIADRLCGAVANPMIRNAQEKRQLDVIQTWLIERGYRPVQAKSIENPEDMLPGTFAYRMSVTGWLNSSGDDHVNIPVDVVIKPRLASAHDALLFVEAKSAGDFTNVNKRRKEEAAKARHLRHRFGSSVPFVLFLGGYFDSGYLGYEAAEGIDWVWEHRVSDFSKLGL